MRRSDVDWLTVLNTKVVQHKAHLDDEDIMAEGARQGSPEDVPALVDTTEGTLNIDAETALVEGERFLSLSGAAALLVVLQP